ncbi:MAG: PAS domain S-box protein [Polyangiaceae bacterium]|nr:PAS domain S-box protein [Polyangiaceae bacterium]
MKEQSATSHRGQPSEIEHLRARVRELEKFEKLFDALPFGVTILDAPSGSTRDASIGYFNQQANHESGLALKTLQGLPLQSVFPDDYKDGLEPAHAQVFERVRRTGTTEMFETDRGDRGYIRAHYLRLDECSIAAVYQNITAKKRIEEALRASESRFREAINSAPLPMIIHDENDNVVAISAGLTRLFGYDLEDVPTTSAWIARAYGPTDARRGLDKRAIDQIFESKTTVNRGERIIRTKDGTERTCEMFVTPILGSVPRIMLSMAIDLTERRKAEEVARVLQQSLETRVAERTLQLDIANRELEAFAYSVAHDLRAPLRGMNGFANVLLEDYGDKLDAAGRDCLEEIHSNASKMGELIDALLSLSRVTRSEIRRTRVNFSDVAKGVLRELAVADPQRNVEVVFSSDLEAEIDPQLARILVDNLLGNAWKFTRKVGSPRIEFGSTTEGTMKTFFVRDNGAGFDMTYTDKLFAPFQRLHSAADYPGTGIGLATVQRIVHRHEGRVWAKSGINEGATFFFTLPIANNEAAPCTK